LRFLAPLQPGEEVTQEPLGAAHRGGKIVGETILISALARHDSRELD
jgi:hypothetical protein